MDDTLCQLIPRAIHYHNLDYPDHPLLKENIVGYDVSEYWHPECSHDRFFGRPGLFAELEVYDEFVLDAVKELSTRYDIIVITASSPEFVVDKWGWMQKYLPFIPYENFFVAKRKSKIDFDLLIDDGAHNLLEAAKAGRQAICISQPWNAPVRDQFPCRDSWEGLVDLVDELLSPVTVPES